MNDPPRRVNLPVVCVYNDRAGGHSYSIVDGVVCTLANGVANTRGHMIV